MTTTITNAREGMAVKKMRMPHIICMMEALQTLRMGRSPFAMLELSASWVDSERMLDREVDWAILRVEAICLKNLEPETKGLNGGIASLYFSYVFIVLMLRKLHLFFV